VIYYQFLNLRFSEVQALASFQATLGFRAYFVWQGSREISFISFPTIVFSTKFFFLIFRHFIASLLLELRVSFFFLFFPITQKNTFSWLSSIHCQLQTLLSCCPASFMEWGPLSEYLLAPCWAQLCMQGVVLYPRNMESCGLEGLNALQFLPFCFVKEVGLCCEIINPPIFSLVQLRQVGEQRTSWMHLLLCWNQLKVPIQVVSAQYS